MTSTREKHTLPSLEAEDAQDSLKRMIYFTKREAEKDGRSFCAYFLEMALNALEEDSEEINEAVRSKIVRLPIAPQDNARSA
ncbi:hypothetical protein GCM10011316_15580 [Roseibium aquae]|uniref:Uncharacterized protein n=1 Tax=Roseibium aquae TaxID=1323746 RepID=A0A916X079_9HYPH|nr:hypothetical protein [Roseibium aquae]GGB44449.1 hypothetical protein GCM10011316_15580 [Roseibium aquae]